MPASTEPSAAHPPRRVLLVDVDRGLVELIEAWLVDEGFAVAQAASCMVQASDPVGRVDLAILEVPFPRQGGVDCARRIGSRFPGVPILALSSTFFAGVESDGPVARALGVDRVLAKPLSRDSLMRAVHRLLPPTDVNPGPLDAPRGDRATGV